MKNLKIYKSAVALLTSTSFLLMSGCSSDNNILENDPKTCIHLTVYFENKPITFKECEGYDMTFIKKENSKIKYNISKNNEEILSGVTTDDNMLEIYHDEVNKILDLGLIKKYK